MRPCPWCSQQPRRRGQGGGGPGDVDREHPGDAGRDPLRPRPDDRALRPRRPPGRPVLPAASKHRATVVAGGSRVHGVESHRRGVLNRRSQLRCGLLRARRVAPSQDDRPASRRGETSRPATARCPTCRRGRRPTGDVRRRRSPRDPEAPRQVGRQDAVGVDATADRRELVRAAGTSPGPTRGAGGRLWPGRRGRPRPPPARRGRRAAPGNRGGPSGKSRASVQPSLGEGERPGRARTESLEHGEERRHARRRRSQRPPPRRRRPGPGGTTNWYCTKPAGPYSRFQPPTASSGWKKLVRVQSARPRSATLGTTLR